MSNGYGMLARWLGNEGGEWGPTEERRRNRISETAAGARRPRGPGRAPAVTPPRSSSGAGSFRSAVVFLLRAPGRRFSPLLFQEPPRSTRRPGARRDHELLLQHHACRCVSSPSASGAAEDRLDRPVADGRHPRTVDPPPTATVERRIPARHVNRQAQRRKHRPHPLPRPAPHSPPHRVQLAHQQDFPEPSPRGDSSPLSALTALHFVLDGERIEINHRLGVAVRGPVDDDSSVPVMSNRLEFGRQVEIHPDSPEYKMLLSMIENGERPRSGRERRLGTAAD